MFLTCRTVQKGGLLGFVIMTSRGQDWTENKKNIIGQKVVRAPFLKNAAYS